VIRSWRVNKHLPRRKLDLSLHILRKALSALLDKLSDPGQRSIRVHLASVCPLFRLIGRVKRLPADRLHQPIGLKNRRPFRAEVKVNDYRVPRMRCICGWSGR
jgi:hypothetical protein